MAEEAILLQKAVSYNTIGARRHILENGDYIILASCFQQAARL
jgi:hypothetical protein